MKKYLFKGRMALSLMAAASMIVFMTSMAMAKTTSMKDEKKLDSGITMLDKYAGMPNGEQVLTDHLTKKFNITADQLKALRDKDLKYGDIAAIYAFADKMPGGITDDNVNKVVSLRKDNKTWGDIAKQFDVKLASVSSKVNSIEKGVHKDIKKAETSKSTSGAGGGAGGGKMGDTGGGKTGGGGGY